MYSRNLLVGLCLLVSVVLVGNARAAERATATLRIEVRVREVVRPPHPPRKDDDSGVAFSLMPESKFVKTEAEEKLNVSANVAKTDKEGNAVIRTTTYTIE
jgi:hypothetical protein